VTLLDECLWHKDVQLDDGSHQSFQPSLKQHQLCTAVARSTAVSLRVSCHNHVTNQISYKVASLISDL
jgi:hypothetical protein